jgi:hypothetical protein
MNCVVVIGAPGHIATWPTYPRRYFPGRFHDPVKFVLVIRRKSFAVKKIFAVMLVPAWLVMPESGNIRI